jgi:probable HAF family extracellular repeat protein
MNLRAIALAAIVLLVSAAAASPPVVAQQAGFVPARIGAVPPGPPQDDSNYFDRTGSLGAIASGASRSSGTNSKAATSAKRSGSFREGTRELQRRREERGDRMRPEDTTNTIPYWSDSFNYQGLVFKYKMVGRDPSKGSSTTVIPTFIVPLRFVFPDGQIFDSSTDLVDGQTAIQGIVNSPIFKNYPFVLGGTNVGTTQYGDALQRANFWDSVSTRAGNYHVLLGQPTVLPTQTIVVPPGLGFYFTDPDTGAAFPVVNRGFLGDQERSIRAALKVSPRSLPILVWGSVVPESTSNPGHPGAAAWHGAESANGGLLTFISTTYNVNTEIGIFDDVYPLSHEVAEWMDDPFADNYSAGWNYPFLDPISRCDSSFVRDLMEVADPVEIFQEASVALPGGAFTYHVTEAMFVDFYTRRDRSRSVNGQYSMFTIGAPYGLPSEPSSPCTGHVEFKSTYVEFPGASFTAVTGMNSQGELVGYYFKDGRAHAFLRDGSELRALDIPGDLGSAAWNINDAGMIVGYFYDSSGQLHGFSYYNGRRRQIDFPGAADTIASGINSRGDIVGGYDNLQPITHAFVLRGGQYQRIDAPYGAQAVASGINDAGVVAGYGSDDLYGSVDGFRLSRGRFDRFDFPGALQTIPYSINNANDLAGAFVDPDGKEWGMATVRGQPHQIYTVVFGNDDNGHIVGYAYDYVAGRYKGLIGELPLQRNGP